MTATQTARPDLRIVDIDLATTIAFLAQIPEFTTTPDADEAAARIAAAGPMIALGAVTASGEVVGVKLGYQLTDTMFYSWLGGVAADWRRHGVARLLLDEQHRRADELGCTTIRVKSMNRYPAMLRLLIGAGYQIVDVEGDNPADLKVVFEHTLAGR